MVQIKRFFCIFLIIASLLGLSSCGKKGSNSFKELSFRQSESVTIVFKGKTYESELCFNGALLALDVFLGEEKADRLEFSVDSRTCTTRFKGLETTVEISGMSENALPVIVFDFVSRIGADFTTEIFNEENNEFIITRNVGLNYVSLSVREAEDKTLYFLEIK